MRNTIYLVMALFAVLYSCKKEDSKPTPISMGAGYVNDIYYSLKDGVIKTVPGDNWDIAFNTNAYSSTIITNGGSGVELYTYPKGDTTSWNSIDTLGLSNWPVLYNSDTTWNFGAFERNTMGHPDYGWGVYNSLTHNIIGDSIYIIKLVSGEFKKLRIKEKFASTNKYLIVYADINGDSEITKNIDCVPYENKNHVFYSLSSNSLLDREPDKTQWDFVFTKYITKVAMGPGVLMDYAVVGALSNATQLSTMGTITFSGIRVAQLDGVDVTSNNYSTAQFGTSISIIGYDWKSYNGQTYTIVNDRVYFVKNEGGSVYKVVFNSFESSTGTIGLENTKLN